MKFVFCSYADGPYFLKCEDRLNSQIASQGFDEIRNYRSEDIDPLFRKRHKDLFSMERPRVQGPPVKDGFFCWKPYLLLKTLNTMSDGDILLYMDTEDIMQGPPKLKSYLQDTTEASGLSCIGIPLSNGQYTKRDAFVLMGCDNSTYRYAPQMEAGFVGIKKSVDTLEFVSSWLTYTLDLRISNCQLPNEFGENYPEFVAHRHDQSVYSLLSKKYNIPAKPLHSGPQSYGLHHMLNIPLENK